MKLTTLALSFAIVAAPFQAAAFITTPNIPGPNLTFPEQTTETVTKTVVEQN